MKTGFLHGNAWKQLYKSYYYHGLLMQCRKEPTPIQWIEYNTTPPINPPNYYYECDGLPPTATPPMSVYKLLTPIVSNSGGLLLVECNYFTLSTTLYGGTWTFPQAITKITLEASHPEITIVDTTTAGSSLGAQFLTLGTGSVVVRAFQFWKKIGGINTLTSQYTKIIANGTVKATLGYSSYHLLEIIKITLNHWDIYYNGNLIMHDYNAIITGARGWLEFVNIKAIEKMDYMRVWRDIDRIP